MSGLQGKQGFPMGEAQSIVTLTTDFGTSESFVGVMKGVILGIHPRATIVDLTHEIPPQDIHAAAYHLSNAWRHFPSGTVHLAVVDPGVGSSRRALAVCAEEQFFLAPDNGLLTPILSLPWRAHALTARRFMAPEPSPTFHGRDVFAHAAAHLASGRDLEDFGERVDDPVRLSLGPAEVSPARLRARVLHVDRFGNVILNVERADLARAQPAPLSDTVSDGCEPAPSRLPAAPASAARPEPAFKLRAEIGGRFIDRFVTHYEEANGNICFLINSDGRLEIALPGGSAAAALGISRGSEVVLNLRC